MMYRPLVHFLFSVAATVLLVPAAIGAEGTQRSDDDVIRSACVMVKAHITRRGAAPIASATGTGFFVAPDLILTCNHCTRIPMRRGMVDANDVQVELDGGEFVSARVIARDAAHDLALLQIDASVAGEAGCKPLSISRFDLSSGAPITIVGNFPEAIRLTRGELVTQSVMAGFAMGNAKVRSGFSGGPVLTSDGKVQGILSQRDDDNNSIFVRSDVILSLLSRTGRPVAAPESVAKRKAEQQVASADKAAEKLARSEGEQEFQPASKTVSVQDAAAEDVKAEPKAAEAAMVVALPVRPAAK